MTAYKSFQTQRLLIKPTDEQDADLIYKLMNTSKFIQFVGDRNITSLELAKKYIQERMIPQLNKLGYSNYTISLIENGQKIGTCGLYNRAGVDGIDIGFGLLPDYEGFGYAYEASSKLLEAAFKEFGIKTIKAITSKENIASQKLLIKLGLELVGTTKIPNDEKDLLLYMVENS
jgi:ribosomal-protein-alanine N-acetyltransferase